MFTRFVAALHRHPRVTVAIALVGCVVFFYLPLVLGVRTFPDGDFIHHFLPFNLFQRQAIANFRLPLWNPHTYGGHPFLADTQAAVLYPVSNLLLALTLPMQSSAGRLYVLQVEAILHTILGGWFVYLLVAEVVKTRWAALLAALAFALSGYIVAYPPLQIAVLRTGIWLPLILWLLLRAARGTGRWGWTLAAAAALACAFFAGHPQTFLYIAWTSVAWMALLCALVWRDQGGRQGIAQALHFAAAFVIAAGLAAAQWLPSLEFTWLSVRANVDYDFVSGGFPLRDAWQVLLPGVFTHYSPLYLGSPVLILFVTSLAGVRTRWLQAESVRPWRSAITCFLAGLALFGVLVSFGNHGPLYPLVYRVLPGWNLFRGQERAAYLVALAISVGAGIGASLLPALLPLIRRRIALACAALVVAAVYGFGLLYQLQGDTVVSHARYLWIALLALLPALATALILWLPGWSDTRKALLLALTVATLLVSSYGINFARRTPQTATVAPPEVAALQAAAKQKTGANLGLDGRIFNEFRVYENYAMRAGLEDLWGASPLRIARYDALSQEFPLDRWWRLFGVEDVLTWRRELFEPSTLLEEFPQASDTTYVHRLTEPNPRAWVAGSTIVADDNRARDLLADHTFDLEGTAILPPEYGATAQSSAPISASISLSQSAPAQLTIQADLDAPGILLLSENWMPGWRVVVDEPTIGSKPPEVLGLPAFSPVRANLTLVGVPLPSGETRLTLTYDPRSVRVGLWISAASLLALLTVLALVARVRRA